MSFELTASLLASAKSAANLTTSLLTTSQRHIGLGFSFLIQSQSKKRQIQQRARHTGCSEIMSVLTSVMGACCSGSFVWAGMLRAPLFMATSSQAFSEASRAMVAWASPSHTHCVKSRSNRPLAADVPVRGIVRCILAAYTPVLLLSLVCLARICAVGG
ncbi:uncharacterized protein F5Z01DRAFT_526211 [Emericellopsis atlantica]|uniref:Uncharacterized protein n=1 Tax=Emericellopsis atlantica TaxID=2614577 RepID=A0A9P8CQI0_9HYPO|nr:uncharacterized protein F5Z01DRAFT_526211 [Emericellopsis atlantica]KAG9255944.1 hypothetical protein F5Z01DRAFT_526211 [Emericellopsis atlantica]